MALPARPAVLTLVGALVLTGALVGVGTALADEETDPEAPFRTTALEDFDTSAVIVRREAFCDDIDPRQVGAALSAEPETESSWANGDRIELPSGERDVVHEFGCEYVAKDGTTARAWVFAPPVDRQRAKRLVKQSRSAGGCAKREAAGFGNPSVRVDCLDNEVISSSYQGLFGDAWLTCELSATDPTAESLDLSDRAGRWCVGVLMATG